MRCAVFQYNSTDEDGNTLSVFKDTNTSVEECGKISTSETVLMSGMQFTEPVSYTHLTLPTSR